MITGVPVPSPHSSGDTQLSLAALRGSFLPLLLAATLLGFLRQRLRVLLLLQIAVRLGVLEQAVDVLPNCTPEYQNKVNCPTGGKSSSVVHGLSSVLVPA